ncbi:MAG: tetratricopeptide repeat protein [Lacipirellulaceae bacterium]
MRIRRILLLASALAATDVASAAPVSMMQCAPKKDAPPTAQQPSSDSPFGWATRWFKGSPEPAAPMASSAFGAGFAAQPAVPMGAPAPGTSRLGQAPLGPWRATASTTPMPAMPPALPALPRRPVAHPAGSVTPENFAATIGRSPLAAAPPMAALQGVEATIAAAAEAEGRGDVVAARGVLQQHLALDPHNAAVLRELAHVDDRAGALADAERNYRASIGADPSSAAAVNDLALCLARQGRLEPAAATLRQAIVMRPDKALYRNNLATILVELGKSDEAHQQLATAYEPAVASFNLGLLLARSGKADEAAGRFREAIALDPSLQPAREALARIEPAEGTDPLRVASLPATAAPGVAPYAVDESETTPIGPMADQPLDAEPAAPSFPRLLPPVIGR